MATCEATAQPTQDQRSGEERRCATARGVVSKAEGQCTRTNTRTPHGKRGVESGASLRERGRSSLATREGDEPRASWARERGECHKQGRRRRGCPPKPQPARKATTRGGKRRVENEGGREWLKGGRPPSRSSHPRRPDGMLGEKRQRQPESHCPQPGSTCTYPAAPPVATHASSDSKGVVAPVVVERQPPWSDERRGSPELLALRRDGGTCEASGRARMARCGKSVDGTTRRTVRCTLCARCGGTRNGTAAGRPGRQPRKNKQAVCLACLITPAPPHIVQYGKRT